MMILHWLTIEEKAISWDTFLSLVAPELVVAKALLHHWCLEDQWRGLTMGVDMFERETRYGF